MNIIINIILLAWIFTCSNINSLIGNFLEEHKLDNYYLLGAKIGEPLDEHNGVKVYYNGHYSNVSGRRVTEDGYNLGLKYQCVEFVKRYYYQVYSHKMPNSYGHAKEYFDLSVADGNLNSERDLVQFSNGSVSFPKKGDIVVFDGNDQNKFGHVAIITNCYSGQCEIIQQNVMEKTREAIKLVKHDNKYYLADKRILGWLRK